MLSKPIGDIPPWFKLTNYDGLSRLTIAQWYEQLMVRYFYLKKIHSHETFMSKQKILPLIEETRRNPVVNISNMKTLDFIGVGSLIKIKSKDKNEIAKELGVSAFTIDDLEHLNLSLPLDHEEIRDTEATIHTHLPYRVTKINLNLPDEVVKKHFALYLSSLRKTNIAPKFSLSKLTDYKVLPYLDLLIWEEEKEFKLTNKMLADALFKEGEKDEEFIRRTLRPFISQILTPSFLGLLEESAKSEAFSR